MNVSELITPGQSQGWLELVGLSVLIVPFVRESGKKFLGPNMTNLTTIFTKLELKRPRGHKNLMHPWSKMISLKRIA